MHSAARNKTSGPKQLKLNFIFTNNKNPTHEFKMGKGCELSSLQSEDHYLSSEHNDVPQRKGEGFINFHSPF